MKYLRTDRKIKFIVGVGIMIFMVSTPFLFYTYRFAPSNKKVWDISFFTIYSGGFNSVQSLIHALFTKAAFVLSFILWFLTCKHWWKWSLLVPLILFLFQLTGVVNHNLEYIDNYDFWYSLPIVLPIILFLIYTKNKVKFYTDALDLKEQLDNEIKVLKKEI